jgi:hypothetical protein
LPAVRQDGGTAISAAILGEVDVDVHAGAAAGAFAEALYPPALDLRGKRVTAWVLQAIMRPGARTYLSLTDGGLQHVAAFVEDAQLCLEKVEGAVPPVKQCVVYDLAQDSSWRIDADVAASEIVLEASADGIDYTQISTIPGVPAFLANAQVLLGAGVENGTMDLDGTARFARYDVVDIGCP